MNWIYEEGRIYYKDETGELMGEVTFVHEESGEVNIDHVYVNPILRGQGVAGKIMEEMVRYLKREGKKARATCSYANGWLKRNSSLYSDVISNRLDDVGVACKIK